MWNFCDVVLNSGRCADQVAIRWTANRCDQASAQSGTNASKPGDILVQGGSRVHHSLLLPDDAGPGNYLVVNGNSNFQSVLIAPITRKSVVAVYSLENFSGKV